MRPAAGWWRHRPLDYLSRAGGRATGIGGTRGGGVGRFLYGDSRPVRIGNGAADQLQLDIYGEALYAIYLADRRGVAIAHAGWQALVQVMDWLCDNWDQPEEGIWETRGGRKDFVYGRLIAWFPFARAFPLARDPPTPPPLAPCFQPA